MSTSSTVAGDNRSMNTHPQLQEPPQQGNSEPIQREALTNPNAPTSGPPVQLSQPTGAPNGFGASYVQESLQSNSEPSRGEIVTSSSAPTNAPPLQPNQPTGTPNAFGQNTLGVHDSGPTSNGRGGITPKQTAQNITTPSVISNQAMGDQN